MSRPRLLAAGDSCCQKVPQRFSGSIQGVCDEGFDKEDEVSNHITIHHKDILIQISNNIDSDEEDSSSEESFGDSWLAKFDEDGNRIG